MSNKCDFCKQEYNKDYESKCPTCGSENVQIYSYMENDKVLKDIICGDC